MQHSAVQTINNRYQLLDKLGEGGMGAVYRATDRLSGGCVALKQVTLAGQSPDESNGDLRYALAQEFKMLASLRHPHIISVLDYGFSDNREPYFTLELLEHAQSLVDYGHSQPLAKQVELLIQMLQALVYLHQRGIIHRDLKPDNVLIVNDQVKVLDFGLALAHESLKPDARPAGTLAYMAPETFSGTPVSISSDLYAVGVIIYELLTGAVPFHSTNNNYALMYKIARTPPDLEPLNDSPLRDIVMRLLEKHPADRYASASDVIRALCDAASYPVPAESRAVRESFLQAARFVGREFEFGVLREALDKARSGQGSAWLIGGESGVGKSRLLDELRTQALVDGALVLRGQAIAEGGLPYQIWRSSVRRLCLQTDLTDLPATVLKPIVPDIDKLLGRDVPDTPQVDAQSLQLRLLSVIESMFRQQRQLIVLLLEDLHWADDSLILLKRLNELAAESSLLIVATYRDDERPTLAYELPTLQHIKLDRLSYASVEMLSESMLGEVGRAPDVIDLLTRETEGNVFFIVEVVRALAEDAGQLSDIGRKTLPDHVFAGGMRTVIQHRIDKVPEAARRLMSIAAVAGRQLDLKLLHALVPTLNLDDWLQQVETVIEVRGSHYRFSHDKLREGILASLEAQDNRAIHHEIAGALEAIYPNSPEQYAALAYHWGQAQDASKTIQSATLAGEQSLRSGSYREAIQFFDQALAFIDQVPLSALQLSNLYYLLGEAYWGQTDMKKSREWHIKALALLGFSVPDTPGKLVLTSLKPLVTHLWRRITGTRERAHHEELLVASRSYNQITLGSYHDANFLLGIHGIMNGMNTVEQAGNNSEAILLQSRYYSSLAFAMGDVGIHKIARYYFRLAEKQLQTESDPETLAYFNFAYGAYLASCAQWEQSNRRLEESNRMSKAAGSIWLWVEGCEFQTGALSMQSRFSEALAVADDYGQATIRDDYIQSIGRFYTQKAQLLFLQGNTSQARQEYFNHQPAIEASLSLGDQTVGKIGAQGLLTELYTRDTEWEAALKSAEALNALLANAQTISFVLAGEASASIALYLTLWEKQGAPFYRHNAEAMFSLFHRKYTQRYVIGRPIESMYRCWYYWLCGDEKRARSAGAQAIQLAHDCQMPYYEAAAHYQLGRFMAKDDPPQRAAHMQTALQCFTQIGAAYDADCVARDEPIVKR